MQPVCQPPTTAKPVTGMNNSIYRMQLRRFEEKPAQLLEEVKANKQTA